MRVDSLWNQSIKLDPKTKRAEMLKCTSHLKIGTRNTQGANALYRKEKGEIRKGKRIKFLVCIYTKMHNIYVKRLMETLHGGLRKV